ncbi:MAG: cell division protein FtsH, partial [Cyanobium sp.]
SRAQLRARIMGALGGRAAEDVVFGHAEVTTGAGGDIQQVASIARQMVTRFGMSDLGQLSLEAGNQEVFLGRDLVTRTDGSDALASRIDQAVREIVQSCYRDNVELVAQHRACMDRVVDLLIEKETLDGEEFRAIVSEFAQIPAKDRFTPFLEPSAPSTPPSPAPQDVSTSASA